MPETVNRFHLCPSENVFRRAKLNMQCLARLTLMPVSEEPGPEIRATSALLTFKKYISIYPRHPAKYISIYLSHPSKYLSIYLGGSAKYLCFQIKQARVRTVKKIVCPADKEPNNVYELSSPLGILWTLIGS